MNEHLIKQLVERELATRFDANETAFLARQIEFVRTKVYEVQYAELLAKRFMPLATARTKGNAGGSGERRRGGGRGDPLGTPFPWLNA